MIALRQKATQRPSESTVHAKFLEMLPKIRRQANIAFRNALPEAREELIAEVVANAYSSYCRLVELGKEDVAFATPLACFAIRRVRSCRFLGGRLKASRVMSGRRPRLGSRPAGLLRRRRWPVAGDRGRRSPCRAGRDRRLPDRFFDLAAAAALSPAESGADAGAG